MASAGSGDAAVVTSATASVLDALPADPARAEIERLKQEQQAANKVKKDLTRQVKNAKKRQSRLKKRARLMTDDDLVSVLLMRKEQRETGSSSSSASSAAAGESSLPPPAAPAGPTAVANGERLAAGVVSGEEPGRASEEDRP